jgi:hypothetical protein
MAQTAVVVVFTSRCGNTERTAHAAAVGVVNARALPRLRRLADDEPPDDADCAATIRRMQREYVAPTDADIAGSAALIIVPSAGMTPVSPAWQPWRALLDRLTATGALKGKAGAVIDAGDAEAVAAFSSELTRCGIAVVPAEGRDPRAHGRAVVATVTGVRT